MVLERFSYRYSGVYLPCVTVPCSYWMRHFLLLSQHGTALLALTFAVLAIFIVRRALWACARRPLGTPCAFLLGASILIATFAAQHSQPLCMQHMALSQYREDVTLLPLLLKAANASSARRGSFVEIGALDGLDKSNTALLERCFGWQGLLIEGNPHNFAQLQRSGRAAVKRHSAVCAAPEDGGPAQRMVSFTLGGGMVAAQLDAMSVSYSRQWAKYNQPWRSVSVPCAPLGALMTEAGLARANFLSLDVEGAEPIVLGTVDPSRFDVVVVERDEHDPHKNRAVEAALNKGGLRWVHSLKVQGSRVFVREYLVPAAREAARAQAALRSIQ